MANLPTSRSAGEKVGHADGDGAAHTHHTANDDNRHHGQPERQQATTHAALADRLSPRRCYGEGSAKMVYAITNQGVRTLQNKGLIREPAATDWNFKNRTLHDYSIQHTLLIAHIRAVLAAACKKHPHVR